MESTVWQAFRPDVRGTFVDRPNRFVARAVVDGVTVEAHCPNPGRLTELLYPGADVILERAEGNRRLRYTLVAVERPSPGPVTVVPLVSARANGAVGALVLPRLFPGASLRPEFTVGPSRFDFLVESRDGQRHLIEVKACSEVEFGSALFPDAPSIRARKHLEHLAEPTAAYIPHVVFAVVHGRPRFWAPNAHTDPAFARTLLELAPRLHLHAVVFETAADGTTSLSDVDLPVVLPDLGPDAGHLVRLGFVPETGTWTVDVEWHPFGFEAAAARAPARTSFAIRGVSDRCAEFQASLAPLVRDRDPRHDRAFVDVIMDWRHSGPGASQP